MITKLLPHQAVARLQIAAAIGAMNFRSSFLGMANALQNVRSLQDLNLLTTIALPAAGATAHSPALNLNSVTAGRAPRVELLLSVPALPSLADTKNATHVIEDSADGQTFAAVADLPSVVQTGAGGVGAAAAVRQFKLPIGIRQFIRLSPTVDAAGGNNTGVTATLAAVF